VLAKEGDSGRNPISLLSKAEGGRELVFFIGLKVRVFDGGGGGTIAWGR